MYVHFISLSILLLGWDGMGWSDSHSFVDRCNVLIGKGEKKRFRKGYRKISLLFVGSVKNDGQCACLSKVICLWGWRFDLSMSRRTEGTKVRWRRGAYLFLSFFLCPGDKENEKVACYAFFFIFDPPAHLC